MRAGTSQVNDTLVLLVRPDEAAKALAISSRKLWTLTNCGEIPCVRIGRSVRYDVADLESWIERSKTRGPCHR